MNPHSRVAGSDLPPHFRNPLFLKLMELKNVLAKGNSTGSAGRVANDLENSVTRPVPVFWKRWAVSMLAVYPPLVCLVFVSKYVLEGVPMMVSLFIIAFCLTGLSTGLILPFLNRRLKRWLHQ